MNGENLIKTQELGQPLKPRQETPRLSLAERIKIVKENARLRKKRGTVDIEFVRSLLGE